MFSPPVRPIKPLTHNQKIFLITALSLVTVAYYLLRNLQQIGMGGAPHLDIATFYAAAEAVFTAKVSPYNAAVLQTFRAPNLFIIYPFLYPPSALPFFWPLAGHDFGHVVLFTLYLNAVLIAGLVIGLSLWTLRLTRSFPAALLMIPILTEGSRCLWATLWYGQINAMLALLIMGFVWSYARNHKIPAGILLGISVTLKIYPALLLPWLALRRDWRTLAAGCATILALALFSWLWLPHYLWSDWISKVVLFGYGTQPPGLIEASNMGNLNIHGVLMRSFTDALTIKLLAYAAAGALLMTGFYTAWRRPEPWMDNCCAILWLTLIIAPLTWLSQITYLLFIPVWFLAKAWTQGNYLFALIFAGIYGYVLQLTQTDAPIPLWRMNMPCAGLLALWAMMLWQIWRNKKAG